MSDVQVANKMPQRFTRVVKGSFNDQRYIADYHQKGLFPQIHDQVAHLVKEYANESEPCIDLGSCTGLLGIQAVELGRSFCVGIDGNPFDFNRAVPHPRVKYYNLYIGRKTLVAVAEILKKYRPTLILARRILSEIDYYDDQIMGILPGLFHQHGVKKIILQGRVKVKNPKVRLYCTEEEIKPFEGYFKVTQTYKQSALLEA